MALEENAETMRIGIPNVSSLGANQFPIRIQPIGLKMVGERGFDSLARR